MGNRFGTTRNGSVNSNHRNYVEIRTDQGVYRIGVRRPRGSGNIYVRGRGSIYVRGRGRTYGTWSTHVRSGYVSFERTNERGFRSSNAINQDLAAVEEADDEASELEDNSGVDIVESSSTDGDFEDAEESS
ncbi:uncharacterized protein LOC119560826 [Drosophila subpulchrella]|uniref:uncharacterized protein LOC119560826 n=1 Tax=Drosophila subpulchrella TaxID=1486046 RepID=UPI0018A1A4A2|nr:uncharacterized protein LOC119560826 [Drosophila subpulchrella]